jgi:glucuronate isomerase
MSDSPKPVPTERTERPAEPERRTEPAPEWPKAVRTTFRPDDVIRVDEAEYTDLSRQGLLVDETKEE